MDLIKIFQATAWLWRVASTKEPLVVQAYRVYYLAVKSKPHRFLIGSKWAFQVLPIKHMFALRVSHALLIVYLSSRDGSSPSSGAAVNNRTLTGSLPWVVPACQCTLSLWLDLRRSYLSALCPHLGLWHVWLGLWRPTYLGASLKQCWRPICRDGGSASAHCQQCFGDLPTSVLPRTLSAQQVLVAYVSGSSRWQCFSSLLPCNNASATYLLRCCFGDLPTSVLPLTLSAKASVGGWWWRRFSSLLPTMLWRPTYTLSAKESAGGLRVRRVVMLQFTLEPHCVSRTWPATKGLSRSKSLRSPGCQSWGNPWRTNLEGLPFHGLRGLFSFYSSVRERFCTASAFLLLADSGSRIAIFWV